MSAMLAPNDRELLLDALRPDPGTTLDAAVGTTFTLDLEALLLAPLAFALFETDGATPDPTALLAAIQQHAERIALYCDAAHIRTRAEEQRLFVLLESTVLAVNAPLGGSFHPKLWVLRFRTPSGEHQHRVLVMSRNLTFDTSWDLVARFDQEPAGAPLGTSVADVVRTLANVRPSALASSVADSVETATFSIPPPFHSARLHATGFRRAAADPIGQHTGTEALVISPFLTAARLAAIQSLGSRKRTLVSRPDELERLGAAALTNWGTPLVLRENAQGDPAAPDASDGLRGLHAKLFVSQSGDDTTWFLGSANATTAAHTANVEAFIELHGPTRKIGVAALLDQTGDSVQFRALLEEFTVENAAPQDATDEELEDQRLEQLCRELAQRPAEVAVSVSQDGWDLAVRVGGPPIPLSPADRLSARLVTTASWTPASHDSNPIALLHVARSSEITSLVALRLRGDLGVYRDLVIVATLIGAPEDRLDQVLLDLVPDSRRFALLLFLMLAAGDHDMQSDGVTRRVLAASEPGPDAAHELDFPLFESLVRTSAREPQRLIAIDRLIARFSETEDGRSRLPEGLAVLWEAFHGLIPNGAP